MRGVVMIGGGDHDRIDIGQGEDLAVIGELAGLAAELFLHGVGCGLAGDFPGIGDGSELDVLCFGVLVDAGEVGMEASSATAYEAEGDALIGADDAGVGGCGGGEGGEGGGGAEEGSARGSVGHGDSCEM